MPELGTIAGDGEVFEFLTGTQAGQQRGQALAHQWFATGDADTRDAEADEGIGDGIELFETEYLRPGSEDHVLAHAIGAAEVATVGDREPQVGNSAPERIEQLIVLHGVQSAATRTGQDAGDMDGCRMETEAADFVYRKFIQWLA
ncbi:hypothetical protein D3C78_1437310 [compost metagenome]